MEPSFSCEQPLASKSVVEVLHELPIAVEKSRRDSGLGSKHAFCRLAPAPVRHVRIDICPEAIFSGLNAIPERARARGLKLKPHDRFDGLKAVLPWHRKP